MYYRSLTGFRNLSSYHGIPIRALEGSSNFNLPEITRPVSTTLHFNAFSVPSTGFQKRGAPFKNGQGPSVILTLDPAKFAEKKQERFHFGRGNLKSFLPRVSLLGKSSLVMSPSMDYERSAMGRKRNYPPDTKAFLYYSIPSDKPRIAGEIRLRVTSSDDHSSFESGSDLLRTNGRAWSRPLYFLPKYYTPLYDKLREDRLVQDDLHAVLSNLPSKCPIYGSSSILYTLNDTFIVDFNSVESNFVVITERCVDTLAVHKLFSDSRGLYDNLQPQPYTGAYTNRYLPVLQ
jgi:hypothetical protein